jgi:hypothetical protein
MALPILWIYNNHDNAIEAVLKENGAAINHSNITRVQVMSVSSDCSMEVIADSDDYPAYFTFTQDSLIMKLGQAGISTGKYSCKLNVFDATTTNGIIWEPTLQLVVV